MNEKNLCPQGHQRATGPKTYEVGAQQFLSLFILSSRSRVALDIYRQS